MPASSHITHLNTARNSQTKKPSVTLSAALRNLPSLFIDVTPIFLDLAGALVGALFLLFREQPRQLVGHARDLLHGLATLTWTVPEGGKRRNDRT